MSKLKLKYFIEFSEYVDEKAITNMTEEETEKFKQEMEKFFRSVLPSKSIVADDLSVDFDIEG